MIGVYRLEELIGGGGQARVYRAVDTQINKIVAIKVLPGGWLASPNRRARFEREAHALAALNDPHIAAIYGLATDGDRRGLVLEYVDGQTLGAELAQHASQSSRTGLPVVRALTIARQIALALEAAHEKGIVHRDLKPANIKTSAAGVVKVLDFGIAKLGDAETGDALPDTPTITYEGVVIGTAGYMSPEQARGKAVDRRTDVWAFGCLLYEMLTGRRPFDGETVTDTLAAVVHLEVNWTALPRETPEVIRRLLMRCLQKDAQSRLRDIADARYEVDEALAEIAGTGTTKTRPVPVPVRRIPWLIGSAIALAVTVGVIALVAAWQWSKTGSGDTDLPATHKQLTTLPGEEKRSQLSPNGQWVAYLGGRAGAKQVFVQAVDGDGQGRPVTLPRGVVSGHVWSPDGRELACLVWDGDTVAIHIVPAFYGGIPRQTIPIVPTPTEMTLGRWMGRSLFVTIRTASGRVLQRLDLDTGSRVSLSDKWKVEGNLDMFDVRPDGRLVVFRVFQTNQEDLWIAGIDGTVPRRLTNGSDFERYPLWSTRGERIVFQSNREGQIDLWEITVASGQVRRLTTSPELEEPESTTQDGWVSYRRTAEDAHLWTWDLAGNEQQLTQDARSDLSPAYALEGRLLVFQRSQSSSPEQLRTTGYKLFAGQLNGSGFSRDPEPLWDGYAPRPSPNGLWLAYLQSAGNRTRLVVTEIATTQSKIVSATSPLPFFRDFPLDLVYQNVAWHPKGTELYFVDQPGESVHILRRYRVHASEAESFPATRTSETMTDVYALADGRTVSYLTRSADSCSLHLFDVTAGTDDIRTRFPCSRFVTVRGWTRGVATAVIVRPLKLNDDTTHDVEIMLVPPKGTPSRVKSLDRVFISSVRFDSDRSLLYMTRSEEGIHNMHTLALESWKLVSVTRNRNPDVTFTGVEPLGSGLVIGARHERKSDVWLLEPKPPTGGTPSGTGPR
jgi:serine/threonine protein kinase/Tol biopolymer transport system component